MSLGVRKTYSTAITAIATTCMTRYFVPKMDDITCLRPTGSKNGNSRSAKRATYLEARTKAWGQCRIVPRMLA